jgi:DNA processing protein
MAKKGSIFLNLLNLKPKKLNDIISRLDDVDDLLTLNKFPGLEREELCAFRDSGNLDRELKLMQENNITCVDIFDSEYPRLLKQIDNPPLVLYIKGQKNILNNFSLAIVGSRQATAGGISLAKHFSKKLASLGIIIVSGLARGIDSAAHQAALTVGLSLGVLGSGLLNVYPRENKQLSEELAQNGALISEFPLRASPAKENFPRRNRIVSGLSQGVLVVEAALRSGALITAHLGLEQNREVFAMPGNPESPLSRGTHKLIKQGAKLVDSLEDILEEFPNLKVNNGKILSYC